MLHDQPRNSLYRQGIESTVEEDDFVLDIGCGSGLLSMLAARTSAQHIFAAELDPVLASTAARIIESNGMEDRISIVKKMSTDLVVGYVFEPDSKNACLYYLIYFAQRALPR